MAGKQILCRNNQLRNIYQESDCTDMSNTMKSSEVRVDKGSPQSAERVLVEYIRLKTLGRSQQLQNSRASPRVSEVCVGQGKG